MATIQEIYIALFGRPADPAGLAFFDEVTRNGADLTAIGDLAATAEYQSRFEGMTNEQIINSIYQSLFGRDSESSGLAFWADALATGTFTINNIAIAILDGAQGQDAVVVANKVAAANAFTAALDTPEEIAAYVGDAAAGVGRSFLAPITADPATIPDLVEVNEALGALTGTADTVPPTAPVIVLGPSSINSHEADLVISGTAEANAIVKIYSGNVLAHMTQADGSGAWTWEIGALGPRGAYSFTATATDLAGNVSQMSQPMVFAVNEFSYGGLYATHSAGSAGRGELYFGHDNPADGMARSVSYLQGANVELALDARYAGDSAEAPGAMGGDGHATFTVIAGTDVSFAYSVGVDDIDDQDGKTVDLDDYDFKLLVDTDPGAGENFVAFTLVRQQTTDGTTNNSNSPFEWMEVGGTNRVIADDGGTDNVTQNIQAFTGGLNAGDALGVKLQAFYKGTDLLFAQTSITVLAEAGVVMEIDPNDFDELGTPGAQSLYGNQSSPTFADLIYAGSGNDTVFGYGGADKLYGGSGHDSLYGGTHNDTLYGGSGVDVLHGGDGADDLYGGLGNDIFEYGSAFFESTPSEMDTIYDWHKGDRFDMGYVDPVNGLTFGGIGSEFQEGVIHYYWDSGNTYVLTQKTSSNNVVNPIKIEIIGEHTLSAADFMLL